MSVARWMTFAAVAACGASSPSWAQLAGDPQAILLVERLIDSIGGRDLWARTEYLYIEEVGYWRRYPQGVRTRFYRDLVHQPLRDIFEVLADDHEALTRACSFVEDVRGDEPEVVKLAQHECIAPTVVTPHASN